VELLVDSMHWVEVECFVVGIVVVDIGVAGVVVGVGRIGSTVVVASFVAFVAFVVLTEV
jgi:hypothetical protein